MDLHGVLKLKMVQGSHQKSILRHTHANLETISVTLNVPVITIVILRLSGSYSSCRIIYKAALPMLYSKEHFVIIFKKWFVPFYKLGSGPLSHLHSLAVDVSAVRIDRLRAML